MQLKKYVNGKFRVKTIDRWTPLLHENEARSGLKLSRSAESDSAAACLSAASGSPNKQRFGFANRRAMAGMSLRSFAHATGMRRRTSTHPQRHRDETPAQRQHQHQSCGPAMHA